MSAREEFKNQRHVMSYSRKSASEESRSIARRQDWMARAKMDPRVDGLQDLDLPTRKKSQRCEISAGDQGKVTVLSYRTVDLTQVTAVSL